MQTVSTAPPQFSIPPLVVDIPEAQTALRCGRTKVYELLDNGELTGVKIGRKRLVTWSSIEAFVARQSGEVA
ncbi:MAG: helix-turn-helix domain-containing protein [Nocardioidaceae bacterium]